MFEKQGLVVRFRENKGCHSQIAGENYPSKNHVRNVNTLRKRDCEILQMRQGFTRLIRYDLKLKILFKENGKKRYN